VAENSPQELADEVRDYLREQGIIPGDPAMIEVGPGKGAIVRERAV